VTVFDPRLWIAALLALAAAFGAGYFKGNTNGRKASELAHAAAVAVAEADSRRLERARQSRADQAASIAAGREAGIRAAADRARRDADLLRNDLSAALDFAAESHAAAQRVASVATELLGRCTALYLGVAEAAARADSEARELRDSWPTDSP
jgi:hypothetical protein